MLTMKSILVLMALHFLADQILQFKTVQLNKNKNTSLMVAHVLTWGLFILPFGCFAGCITQSLGLVFGWPLTMMVIHFATEWGLSRCYSYFYENKQIRMFTLLLILEHFIIMASMIMLFNYFFWLG